MRASENYSAPRTVSVVQTEKKLRSFKTMIVLVILADTLLGSDRVKMSVTYRKRITIITYPLAFLIMLVLLVLVLIFEMLERNEAKSCQLSPNY